MEKKGMRKRREALIVLGSMITVAVISTGCEKKRESPVEITLMHGWGGTLPTSEIMTEIYEEFDRQNEDIVLNYVPYPDCNTAVKKANDMLAVGKTPDIIATNGVSYYVKNAAKEEKAMDLMPYIEKDPEWKSSISPLVFNTWLTGADTLYTIPDAMEAAGYWYNEKYLQEAGWVDEAGNVKEPRTWEEFLQMTEKVQKWIDESGQDITVFALEDTQVIENLFLARLAGEGRNGLAASENSFVKLQEETLKNTLDDLKVIGEHASWVENIQNARQYFYEGKSVIYFNGVWESDILKNSPQGMYLKCASYPTNEGKTLSYVSASSGYVLTKQEDERKNRAEVEFLKYMLSEDVQTRIAIETGQAPENPNVDMAQITEEDPMFGSAVSKVYDADIKLATVFSVWTEKDVNVLKKYLNSNTWAVDQADKILLELNGD